MSKMSDLWYDWLGINTWLFKSVNSLTGLPFYDDLMVFITAFGDKHNLPYMLILISAFVIMSSVVQITTQRGSGKTYLFIMFNIFFVMGASLASNLYTASYLKNHFAFPRPYVALPKEEVKTLVALPADDAYKSFPSGHAALITVLVASLWPIMSENFRWGGILLTFGVCWSRMALGVHYPMDVITGVTLALLEVTLIRKLLYLFYRIIATVKGFIFRR